MNVSVTVRNDSPRVEILRPGPLSEVNEDVPITFSGVGYDTPLDEAGLTYLHVFPFSPRPGTPAAKMPQLERSVIRDRALKLREKGELILKRYLDVQTGSVQQLLMERGGMGRTAQFTLAKVADATHLTPGTLCDVHVSGNDGSRLEASLCSVQGGKVAAA